MTSPQKTALSLLIAVIAFSAFSILAFSGLFDYVETNFYDPRVTQTVERRLNVGAENADRFHSHNRDRFEAILSESAFRTVFRVNQSASDISSRERLVGLLREEMSFLSGLRFVDLARERLWFSTYERDLVTRTPTSREYSPLSEVETPVPLGDLGLEEGVEFAYRFEPELNQFIYRFLIYDEFDIARGTALVYVNGEGLSTSLVRAGTLSPGEEVRIVDDVSALLNAMDTHAPEAASVLSELTWNAGGGSAPKPVIELGGEGYVVFREEGQYGEYLWLSPERNFAMTEGMRWTLLGASFVTMFLLGFLFLNLRQDPTVVLTHRVKRFQIDLLREYIENKEQLDWDRWKGEIERRRSDVDKEIKRGIGRLKKKDEAQVDALLDKSWNEIFEVIGGSRRHPAIETNVDFGRLEKMVERVVAGFQAGQGSSTRAGSEELPQEAAKVTSDEREPEDLEEDLEELAEEPEELEEEPEELEEEPEELEEEPEELEELAEEPEELEEEPEELEEEPEELEELEEEPEELAEEPEELEEEPQLAKAAEQSSVEPGEDLKAELSAVQEDWELGGGSFEPPPVSSVFNGSDDEVMDSASEIEAIADFEEDFQENVHEREPEEAEELKHEIPAFGITKVSDEDEEGLEVLEEVDDLDDEEATEVEPVEPSFGLIDYGPSLVRRQPVEPSADKRDSNLWSEAKSPREVADEEASGEGSLEESVEESLEEPIEELSSVDEFDGPEVVALPEELEGAKDAALPAIDDCDLITIDHFLSIVQAAGAHVGVRVEHEDGVPRIDVAMYENKVKTEPEIQELVDSIINGTEEDHAASAGDSDGLAGIESLFDGRDLGLDLLEGARSEPIKPHDNSAESSSKKRASVLINENGVIYDLHAAGYRNSDSGMVKSLIEFTRIWRAQFGALLLPYEDGLHIQHSLGIPGEDTEAFIIPESSEFRTKVIDQRLVALLRGPLGEHKRLIGFSGEATFSTGQSLFLPIKFRALSGYALLGLRHESPSIQAVVERAKLDAIQVHTG